MSSCIRFGARCQCTKKWCWKRNKIFLTAADSFLIKSKDTSQGPELPSGAQCPGRGQGAQEDLSGRTCQGASQSLYSRFSFHGSGNTGFDSPVCVTEEALQNFRTRRDLKGHLVQLPVCKASSCGAPVIQNTHAPSRDGPFQLWTTKTARNTSFHFWNLPCCQELTELSSSKMTSL